MNLSGINFTSTASVMTFPAEFVSVKGVSKLALVTYPARSVFVWASETAQLARRDTMIAFILLFGVGADVDELSDQIKPEGKAK